MHTILDTVKHSQYYKDIAVADDLLGCMYEIAEDKEVIQSIEAKPGFQRLLQHFQQNSTSGNSTLDMGENLLLEAEPLFPSTYSSQLQIVPSSSENQSTNTISNETTPSILLSTQARIFTEVNDTTSNPSTTPLSGNSGEAKKKAPSRFLLSHFAAYFPYWMGFFTPKSAYNNEGGKYDTETPPAATETNEGVCCIAVLCVVL